MAINITVLIPVYNEEENIHSVVKAIRQVFLDSSYNYELFFVDDGSTDNTLEIIKEIVSEYKDIYYLSFSRNFGKDNALFAGFKNIDSDCVITIDADMQHPFELIPTLITEWLKGYDIVYTFREEPNRHTSFYLQMASKLFYHLISKLANVKMEDGLSDFRLVDRNVANVIKQLNEGTPFLRGLFKWVGFKQKGMPYIANPRLNGSSKYSSRALVNLALNSITSFSTKPLTIAVYIGFLSAVLSVLYIPYVLYSLVKGIAISGWASIIVTIAFFGGVQLIILGIIGMYLGKLFMQSKHRPNFIIAESKTKVKTSFAEKYV